jgi:hypothetical protein
MLEKLNERMSALSGEEEPLVDAIVPGDTGYFTEQNLQEADDRGIQVLIPEQQFRKGDEQFEGRPEHGGKGRFTAEDIEYDEQGNQYRCPADKELTYQGQVKLNRNSGEQ